MYWQISAKLCKVPIVKQSHHRDLLIPLKLLWMIFLYFCTSVCLVRLQSPEWQRPLKIPSLLGNYRMDRFAHHYPWYFRATHSLVGRIQCCGCDRLFCCWQWPVLAKDCLLSFRTLLCIVFTGLLILAGLWLLTEYIHVLRGIYSNKYSEFGCSVRY